LPNKLRRMGGRSGFAHFALRVADFQEAF